MVLSSENKEILRQLIVNEGEKEKMGYFTGKKAINEAKKIFFSDDKNEGDKFENRWTDDEKKTLFMSDIFIEIKIKS